MPIINGNYYANPQYGRHIEDSKGEPSIAKELHKSRGKIERLFAESSEDSLLDMIPKIDLSKK
jgi:hypothetical protein